MLKYKSGSIIKKMGDRATTERSALGVATKQSMLPNRNSQESELPQKVSELNARTRPG